MLYVVEYYDKVLDRFLPHTGPYGASVVSYPTREQADEVMRALEARPGSPGLRIWIYHSGRTEDVT